MSKRKILIIILCIAAAVAIGALLFARQDAPAPSPTVELGEPPRYNNGEMTIVGGEG